MTKWQRSQELRCPSLLTQQPPFERSIWKNRRVHSGSILETFDGFVWRPSSTYVSFLGSKPWLRTCVIQYGIPVHIRMLFFQISGKDFQRVSPDPVAKFSNDVAKAVNSDRPEALQRAVEGFLCSTVDVAQLKRVDRYGVDVVFTAFGRKLSPCRIPFSIPVRTRQELLQRLDQWMLPAADKYFHD